MGFERLKLVASVVAALLLVSACGQSAVRTQTLDASWAYRYGTLNEVVAASDTVIVGTVTATTSAAEPWNTAVLGTDGAVTVDQVLKGQPGKTIVVHQTGGTVGGLTQEIPDDPVLTPGSEYILFLTQFAPGHYYMVGGPEGRLVVQQGLAYSLSAVTSAAHNEDLGIHGEALSKVTSAIQAGVTGQ